MGTINRGGCRRGKRLNAKLFYGHGKTMTFLAALRHDRSDAPWVFGGPINAASFRRYGEEVLVAARKPGEIVVLANLGSPKGKTPSRWDPSRRRKARLPPALQPDRNPIAQVFAKLKPLRMAAKRTVAATWRQIGAVLEDFSPEECQRYLVTAGYGSTSRR